MNKNIYQRSCYNAIAITSALAFCSVSHAEITAFSDDFESYTIDSTFAPWEYFSDNGGLGAYGTVIGDGPPSTQDFGGISALVEFDGNQFLNFFANYNNAAVHNDPSLVETISFYRSFAFDASDTATGATWFFDYMYFENADFPISDDESTQVGAYIQVFEGSNPVPFITVQSPTNELADPADPTVPSFGQVSLTLDPAWTEGFLAVGFYNITGQYENSGRFYDNVGFYSDTPAVPVPAAIWLFGSGLLGLIGIARRKKS